MNFDPVIYSIPIFFVLIGIEIAYDYYRVTKKNAKSKYRLKDALNNIGCGVFDQILAVFAKVFTLGMYALVYHWSEQTMNIIIPSNWLWFLLFFIAVDFSYYFAHRWSHQVNFLWLGHVVHHQSEEYNLTVALRQGAFQKILTFWVYLPLAFLGFPPEWMLVAMGFNLLYQFWIHTEMIGKMGWFELVFNTPSHHRVHHGKNDKYIDKNHAGVFIVWDKMLGTFQAEEETPSYGITEPTKSFNPIWSHIQPFVRFFERIKNVHGISNKVKFTLLSPGWIPSYEVKPQTKTLLNKTKFKIQLKNKIHWYILIQFVVNMGVGAWFLNNQDLMTSMEMLLLLSLTILYLFTLGMMMDKSKFGRVAELARHLINVFIACLFYFHYDNKWVALCVFMFTFASIFWVNKISKTETRNA